jgi:PhnB protein
MSDVRPIPEGYHTVTAYMVVRGAAQAIDFYRRAFGAEELFHMDGTGGTIAHAEMRIGDSIVMIGDAMPEREAYAPSDLTPSTSPVQLFIYTEDVDAAFQRAIDAGAKVEMPLENMFWGDRYGKLVDPYGHRWSMATHIEDVPPEEMERRMAAAFAVSS